MAKSAVKSNIAANIIARLWGFISTYLFTPLYLNFLGIEAFGLVGFFSTLMGIIVLVDMGFTATLNRELARLSVRDDSLIEMRNLVRTYEVIYFWISLFLMLLIWILAPLITEFWLNSNKLSHDEITYSIRLMGMAIAFQLPSGLYYGGLMGLQLQIKANTIQTAWNLLRGIGTILILWLFSKTIVAFAFWQLISNLLYLFIIYKSMWGALSNGIIKQNARFSLKILAQTRKYSIGMAIIALLSTVLMQTDKIVVSKLLSLEMLGYYSLATALASLPLMLANPIASAVFPNFTRYYEKGDFDGLRIQYHKYCKLTSLLTIPASFVIAFFSKDFLFAWTQSNKVSEEAGLATSFLLMGQFIQAIMIVPFYFALSQGHTRLNVRAQMFSILLITPLLIILINMFGLNGGGLSWLIMNLCFLPFYMFYFHSRFLKGELKSWIINDIGLQILITFPIVFICRLVFSTPLSRFYTFGLISAIWFFTTIVIVIIIPEFRNFVFQYFSKMKLALNE